MRRRCAEFLSLLASMVSDAAQGRQHKDEGGKLEAEVAHALQAFFLAFSSSLSYQSPKQLLCGWPDLEQCSKPLRSNQIISSTN